MRKLLVAALLAGSFATPALAQEAPFTGPRVEALVGWDRVKAEGERDNGLAYGVGVGYDFQMGGAVVGVEAEAADSSVKDCVEGVLEAGDKACVKAGRDLYVGGRVGAAVGASTLLYAKAGYTTARITADYDAAPSSVAFNDDRDSANLDGFRIGGGVEQKMGSNAYLKAEYRYSNYEAGVSRHQVLGGVGIRF